MGQEFSHSSLSLQCLGPQGWFRLFVCSLEMAGTGAMFGVLPVARFSAPPPIVSAGAGMSNRTPSLHPCLMPWGQSFSSLHEVSPHG